MIVQSPSLRALLLFPDDLSDQFDLDLLIGGRLSPASCWGRGRDELWRPPLSCDLDCRVLSRDLDLPRLRPIVELTEPPLRCLVTWPRPLVRVPSLSSASILSWTSRLDPGVSLMFNLDSWSARLDLLFLTLDLERLRVLVPNRPDLLWVLFLLEERSLVRVLPFSCSPLVTEDSW